MFDFEIGNMFFKNFDYYDFADANIKTILELEKKQTLLNLKFKFYGNVEVQCDLSMEMFSLELETGYNVVIKFKDDTISMARTTGYTCTAVANLVLDNMFVKKGISPPEFLGDHFNFVNDYLTERDVIYKVSKR